MTRWRIDLAYDGSDFAGWAAQPGQRSVQGVLQQWLSRLLGTATMTNEQGNFPAQLVVAGRTDAGVHARGQVAHLDIPATVIFTPDELAFRLTKVLPADIVIHAISVAPPHFDARFAASWRRYSYQIWDDTALPDPLLRRQVCAIPGRLDLDAMHAASAALLGLRDFAPFCKQRVGATTIRELQIFDVVRAADPSRTITATLQADAFCHSMVRSLMGAIVQVGLGKRDLTWLLGVRDLPSRAGSVPVLPPQGLTLQEVGYPADSELATRVAAARSARTLPCNTTTDHKETTDAVAEQQQTQHLNTTDHKETTDAVAEQP
ncbi:MAG: tRNA pseudouridine(38-40) synthase TruA [Propionibacteriaceae bacterium]|jgi:tRNA pseudouridine38-40 synthase|nr:tRNA pseudouridine(38-40) synthase TruA [Propionibacteriaceae bacterium]